MVNLHADDRTQLLNLLTPLPILMNQKGREAVLISASLKELMPQIELIISLISEKILKSKH
jgi:hypothetical protein